MARLIDIRLLLQSGHPAKYAAIVRQSRKRAEIAERPETSATILPWPAVLKESDSSGDSE